MNRLVRKSAFRFHYLLVVAAVLVPAAIFAVAAWFNREEVIRDGEQAVQRTASIMQQHARKVFDSVDLVIDRVEDRIHDQSRDQVADPATSVFLAAMKNRFDQLASIWIADENGIVLAGSQDWVRGGGIAGRDFFEVHKTQNIGTYISGLFVGKATGLGSFAVSRRRYSPDGRFVGTVHASVNEAYFAEFFRDLAPVRHVASLIRRDGTYLVRHPAPVEPGMLGPDTSFMRAIRTSDSGVFQTLSQRDNLDRFYAYQRVEPYPIYVTYGLDHDVLLSRWYRNLIVYGATLAAASLILLWVSWVALRHMRSERRVLAQLQDEIDQRQQAEERLRRSQRLEAIGQITGGIAHDFNNLLMVITGNAERLRRQIADAKQERYVGSIEAAARRGERLTRQLLAFSRQQTVTPVVLKLEELLPKFPEMLQSSLRGDIEIRIDVAPNLWPVKVDAGELELALLNLSVNARDAMPNGGKLLMSARNVTLAESAATDNLQGDFVAVAVRDTGVGIPPDVVPKIFEPFFTTKEVGKGTGLGLSQVYGFAKQAGGVAVVSSTVGEGTTFTLYLPRTQEAQVVVDEQPVSPNEVGSGTILFVEDNKDIADVTKSNLEELGYRVIAVANADTAMEILKANAEIDVVFSDIVMPGQMNGVDLARAIRAQRPDTPVILTTGYSAAAQAAAPDGFTIIPKPYQLDKLHQIINTALRQRDASREAEAGTPHKVASHA
jgi:signal transduction histidine kinase/ActR/RegA family two-component response regulator